ncbi:MAG: dihydroorotate dehydrogenase-like protein, partial [Sphaerochaetaceae bacterium]|nr:dihydroorotate dehydrogenase-like protein [Sphaerochaetaceae bacterium]
CEKAGAGAVVLKSIFEEQINSDALAETAKHTEFLDFADYQEVAHNIAKDYYINQYVELIKAAKKELTIPVIASINCTHFDTWSEFIQRFEAAGADALELNYYPIASDKEVEGKEVEKEAIAFAKAAKKATKLPIAMKIGYKYSSLANMISDFAKEKVDALVLFNRFYRPDIDIKNEKLVGMRSLSSADEYAESLRWIALMSAEIKGLDFAASTGIHSGSTVVKMLLAGAKVTEVCSVIISKGFDAIPAMLKDVETWMDEKGYKSIADFQGKLAQEKMDDGAHWERTQYMKSLQK